MRPGAADSEASWEGTFRRTACLVGIKVSLMSLCLPPGYGAI